MLDSLQDPQNFGTLIRTAEALGVHGVVIPLARTVDVTPAVVNASSGASEHMLIAQANLSQTIDALKENDVWVVGLDQAGAEIEVGSRHLKGALALVVGSEGEGLHELTRKKCDIVLKLPMNGKIESLNAAVAGSVALYLAYLIANIVRATSRRSNFAVRPYAVKYGEHHASSNLSFSKRIFVGNGNRRASSGRQQHQQQLVEVGTGRSHQRVHRVSPPTGGADAGARTLTAPPKRDRTRTASRSSGAASSRRPIPGTRKPSRNIAPCCAG